MKKFYIFAVLLLVAGGVLTFFVFHAKKTGLSRIREKGVLRILTRNNATTYYIYREKEMGMEYELALAFSKHLGVTTEIRTPLWKELLPFVNQGKGDIVAAGMTITESRKKEADFSIPYLTIRQHAIVHKSNRKIRTISDLAGKVIHVRSNTSYEENLLKLIAKGHNIRIKRHPDAPTEELIRMVAEKEIQITIADTNIARLNRRYYPDIRIAFPVSPPQGIGWAVKKGNKALLQEINRFLAIMKEEKRIEKIYNKYYAGVDVFDYLDIKKYHIRIQERLPKYKELIKEASDRTGFDWRLMAAMIYQESHFNPYAKSHTGVRGIMQLTRTTAKEMGVKNRLDPLQSIPAGIQYLKNLYDRWPGIEGPDRMKFALASYNVGIGHVRDARMIAEEAGIPSDRWNSIRKTLPKLRYPKVYKKTRYGYCRGTEPVRFVKRIMIYYDILRRIDGVKVYTGIGDSTPMVHSPAHSPSTP